jgi:hypothetical protein
VHREELVDDTENATELSAFFRKGRYRTFVKANLLILACVVAHTGKAANAI